MAGVIIVRLSSRMSTMNVISRSNATFRTSSSNFYLSAIVGDDCKT